TPESASAQLQSRRTSSLYQPAPFGAAEGAPTRIGGARSRLTGPKATLARLPARSDALPAAERPWPSTPSRTGDEQAASPERAGRPVGGGGDRRRGLVDADEGGVDGLVAGRVEPGPDDRLGGALGRERLRGGAGGDAGWLPVGRRRVDAGEGDCHGGRVPASRVRVRIERVGDDRGGQVDPELERPGWLDVVGLVDAPVLERVDALALGRDRPAGPR